MTDINPSLPNIEYVASTPLDAAAISFDEAIANIPKYKDKVDATTKQIESDTLDPVEKYFSDLIEGVFGETQSVSVVKWSKENQLDCYRISVRKDNLSFYTYYKVNPETSRLERSKMWKIEAVRIDPKELKDGQTYNSIKFLEDYRRTDFKIISNSCGDGCGTYVFQLGNDTFKWIQSGKGENAQYTFHGDPKKTKKAISKDLKRQYKESEDRKKKK